MKKNLLSTLVLSLLSIFVYAQLPTFEWRIENEQYVNTTTYQFDVNMYNTGGTAFEFKGGTVALSFNPAWLNGGSLGATANNPTNITYSNYGMPAGQQSGATNTISSGTAAQIYMRKIIPTVGATLGTTIPANSKVRLFTMTIQNVTSTSSNTPVAFSTTATPNLTWRFSGAPFSGFTYTDGTGNAVTVLGGASGVQNTNQQYCYTPVYWNGTQWSSRTPHSGADTSFTPTTAHEATIYNGTYSGSLDVRGYTSMAGTIHTLASSEILKVRTELNRFGTLNSSSSSIHFIGNIRKQSTNSALVANKILVNNNNFGVNLGGNLTVNDSLNLTSGIVSIGNFNVNMVTGKHSNASATSYLLTNGTGVLRMNGITSTSGPRLFPVGTSASYTPASITNSSLVADNFQVSVSDSVKAIGTNLTSNVVNKTWSISQDAPGSSVTVDLQWNASDALGTFNFASSYVANVDATGKWIPTTATTASPNGLAFVQTRSVVLNSSFNSFGVGSSNSLPISLLSFTGAKKSSNVELLWKTASEVNAKEFQVERLDNANSFVQIGSVKAVGNTNRISMYSFVDNSPSKQSIRYYRLKMMDYDGNFKYSNVIKVSNENVGNEVTVFPNPTSEKISISNSNLNFASMSFKVMNLTGEVVKVGTASINEINVSDLAAGMYMISVTDESNEAITVKFIKN